MKKRWTAALLALCFVLSLAPYALAVGKPLGSAEPSVLYVSESGSNDKTEPVRKTQQRWIMQQR